MSREIVRGDRMRGRRGRLPSATTRINATDMPGPSTRDPQISRDPQVAQEYGLEPLVRAHLETIPNYCDLDYSKVSAYENTMLPLFCMVRCLYFVCMDVQFCAYGGLPKGHTHSKIARNEPIIPYWVVVAIATQK
jgi:hypothetical protein